MNRIAILLLVVGACKKSEPTAPASGSGSAQAGSASGSAVAGSAPAEAAKPAAPAYDNTKPPPRIDCAKVIPATVIDKYFKGVKTDHREPIVGGPGEMSSATCRFLYDEKTNRKVLLDYTCGPDFVDLDAYLDLLKKQIAATFERVPGVGRGGYRIGKSTVGAQHRSLPCIIHVDLSFLDEGDPERSKDWMAMIGELEAALPDPVP